MLLLRIGTGRFEVGKRGSHRTNTESAECLRAQLSIKNNSSHFIREEPKP